jgi:triphosphoribosyl-dephospho-CoA synthase
MARHPDSLIARKRGAVEAMESAMRASAVLDKGWPHKSGGRDAFADLDAWLRDEGRRRNPGTTADVIAACLFVLLRQQKIALPLQRLWSRP